MNWPEVVAVLALAGVLAFAVARPRDYPEVVAAVPAAVLVVLTGGLSAAAAWHQILDLAPVVVFLVAILVIADACDAEGLFTALGGILTRTSRGSPKRLLTQVFVVASLTTAVLSLDATVVLLTPVVVAAALRTRVSARPHVYACTHLANSASLLLPVSNLTNLLALAASGLSFLAFAGLMAGPWVVAIAVEYVVFRRFFAADLRRQGAATRTGATAETASDPEVRPDRAADAADADRVSLPRVPLVVVAVVLLGFAVAQPLGLEPVWFAVAGAVVLAVRGMRKRLVSPRRVVRAAGLDFAVFVLGLGVVVSAVAAGGLGDAVGAVLPSGTSLPALLGVAAVAALLANLVNNLPAILLLLPLLAGSGPGPVLAALIGVNVGPNLTYVGSLATLLWRRTLRLRGIEPALRDFLTLGVATVPLTLVLAVVALWCSLVVAGI
ncbi:SLC13 family permease [Actinopolymorpha cephalotaxi]|uniref:Arsenical pump membrane protein n=1 Tax=Actinopolymorpha cephalotaxi TaxID=504797 RepID=A0ABX2S3Y0_9ACTN|nr:SLC13 family permease [Actinopolymorpha cephalotaxi]NYH83162.1 arsenical pump membrane protein [Actinopolymorpha cephalotaxi]